MTDPLAIPVFAVVGHPNEGKSSVVATLAEDDSVRISNTPGETVASRAYPVKVDDEEIIRFVDTPGFQHPQALLAWMRQQGEHQPQLVQACLSAHRDQPGYRQDIELLEPLAKGSGIIYVVDGARPIRRHDLAEMEILRLTGNPRMAVINPKDPAADYLEAWKTTCARCFNSTRIFNALQASFAERLALLESLKGIHQDWEAAVTRTIKAFKVDWARRNRRVAQIICDLLRSGLQHKETRSLFRPADEETAKQQLQQSYQAAIARQEARARAEIRRLFKHNIFNPAIPEQSILRADLFTAKTWQLLGLNRKQIVIAAAAVGAGVGIKMDLLLPHLTFGLFTASGAAVAAATAWLQGENMARTRVKRLKIGGIQITVGPNRNPQFPFILLDRLLLFYDHTIHWTHARRDTPPVLLTTERELKTGFTSHWSRERRNTCLRFLKTLSGNNRKQQDDAERAFGVMLEDFLIELSLAPVCGELIHRGTKQLSPRNRAQLLS